MDYQNDFQTNPAPVFRLFSSWQYVNQVINIGASDVYSFVRGNKPSWGIVFNNNYFSRSIEEEIFEQLLDYVTEPKKRVRVCTITGSADYSEEIRTLITHARENKLDVILVLGDRQNELLQSRIRGGDLFVIQPLSDIEIESLIDFLSDNKELHKLEYLERSHQISAIKINYNREVLVAIREATEGKQFNAIIKDEYFGIQDTFSKNIYAIVSCFHQHSALLRTELLAELASVSIIDVYRNTKPFLDGVVYYDEIDSSYGEYVARSRHRFISEIVWNECLTPGERDNIIHSALDKMNIAYNIDRKAFQCFIRSDKLVDSLISLDSKIRFFDKACSIDPDNPYVMQHYARMLVRAKNERTATMIIDQAIKMEPSISMLHHTRGYVLQKLAENDDNIELARRYLEQSEESFLRALRMNEKDAYCYQGLSSLYLMWAKKIEDETEKTLYLSKAEEIVESGLKKASNKEAIWIVSSNIDVYLGNTPGAINALKEAVRSAPNSILSKYLLAKAYNLSGDYKNGKSILKLIVEDHPDEYKASMEYAKSILYTDGTLEQAIAILQQSTLFGYSDERFIAALGGLLFLNKQFTEANSIFDESIKREIYNAQREIFYPKDYALNNIFPCTVVSVHSGYSYVSIDGYKEVRCNSSKYDGVVLTKGMRMKIELAFAPKFPKARVYSINKQAKM